MPTLFSVLGSAKIFSFANFPGNQNGRMFKIVPVTINSSYYGKETCFTVKGFDEAPIDVQPVLPNITLYSVSSLQNAPCELHVVG